MEEAEVEEEMLAAVVVYWLQSKDAEGAEAEVEEIREDEEIC